MPVLLKEGMVIWRAGAGVGDRLHYSAHYQMEQVVLCRYDEQHSMKFFVSEENWMILVKPKKIKNMVYKEKRGHSKYRIKGQVSYFRSYWSDLKTLWMCKWRHNINIRCTTKKAKRARKVMKENTAGTESTVVSMHQDISLSSLTLAPVIDF